MVYIKTSSEYSRHSPDRRVCIVNARYSDVLHPTTIISCQNHDDGNRWNAKCCLCSMEKSKQAILMRTTLPHDVWAVTNRLAACYSGIQNFHIGSHSVAAQMCQLAFMSWTQIVTKSETDLIAELEPLLAQVNITNGGRAVGTLPSLLVAAGLDSDIQEATKSWARRTSEKWKLGNLSIQLAKAYSVWLFFF